MSKITWVDLSPLKNDPFAALIVLTKFSDLTMICFRSYRIQLNQAGPSFFCWRTSAMTLFWFLSLKLMDYQKTWLVYPMSQVLQLNHRVHRNTVEKMCIQKLMFSPCVFPLVLRKCVSYPTWHSYLLPCMFFYSIIHIYNAYFRLITGYFASSSIPTKSIPIITA